MVHRYRYKGVSPDENRPGTLHVGGVVAGSLSQPGAASLFGHLHLEMAVLYTLNMELVSVRTRGSNALVRCYRVLKPCPAFQRAE